MTAITISIPSHEVSFFKKMIAKMGWTYSEADVVCTTAGGRVLAARDGRGLGGGQITPPIRMA